MIIMAGMRTDIPAFYSEWFINRIHEGYALVRNPYNPDAITRYNLTPDVVDCLAFCTKNPTPMLPHLKELENFPWFWYVTLTPYGRDIEPNVPDKHLIVERFKELSVLTNRHNATCSASDLELIEKYDAVHWRYDPIFINGKYSVEQHIKSFTAMSELLEGYTHSCVVSFVDVYNNVSRNFPEVRPVSANDRATIIKAFVEIGKKHDIKIRMCAEGNEMEQFGADCSGCSTAKVLEKAMGLSDRGLRLAPPKKKFARPECQCIIGGDIGAYNNCPHLCKYCYANYDKGQVLRSHKAHDPKSPFIMGNKKPGETIHQAKQESWIVPIAIDLQTCAFQQ